MLGASAHFQGCSTVGVWSLGSSCLHGPGAEMQPSGAATLYQAAVPQPRLPPSWQPSPHGCRHRSCSAVDRRNRPNQCLMEHKYPGSLAPGGAKSEWPVCAVSQQNSTPDAHGGNSLGHPLLPAVPLPAPAAVFPGTTSRSAGMKRPENGKKGEGPRVQTEASPRRGASRGQCGGLKPHPLQAAPAAPSGSVRSRPALWRLA